MADYRRTLPGDVHKLLDRYVYGPVAINVDDIYREDETAIIEFHFRTDGTKYSYLIATINLRTLRDFLSGKSDFLAKGNEYDYLERDRDGLITITSFLIIKLDAATTRLVTDKLQRIADVWERGWY